MSKSIDLSSMSNYTSNPSTTEVAGSHPWSDSLWGSGSRVMVGTVPSSSGSGLLIALRLRGDVAKSLWSRVVVDWALGLTVSWTRDRRSPDT